jgi:hypothetical protein
MKKLMLAGLLALSTTAFAQSQDPPDRWSSGDKRAHFTSGVIISGVTMSLNGSAGDGFLLGCGAGIGGEFLDARKYGWKSYHVSYKDATVECLGAGLASYAGVKLYPNKIVWERKINLF